MRLHLDPSSASGLTDAGRVASTGGVNSAPAERVQDGRETGADSIGISGPSAALSRISAERAGRIRQLTEAVRAGTYNAPAAAIAGALVAQSFTPRADG
jgi:hypothetical protein